MGRMRMTRFVIGCVAAAVAMFILVFILYGSPLSMLAYATASDAANASVQNALAANLPKTGTYIVSWPNSAEGTVLYGRGPVATIHYNTGGFSLADPSAMIGGFIHRSEEHTSELQSLMRISYAVFCLKKKKNT